MRPRRRRFKPKPRLEKRFRANEQIRVPEIRLIDERGQEVGIVSTAEALETARSRGFDLVEVNPVAQPPICKLLNWGAYQYQQEKLERKSRARQHKIEIKGIRLSLKIGKHDLQLRHEQAMRFFERGDKVKIELILRGRERQHADRARTLIEDFIKGLGSGAASEQSLSQQGGRMSLLIGWRGALPKREESAEVPQADETPPSGPTEADSGKESAKESEPSSQTSPEARPV